MRTLLFSLHFLLCSALIFQRTWYNDIIKSTVRRKTDFARRFALQAEPSDLLNGSLDKDSENRDDDSLNYVDASGSFESQEKGEKEATFRKYPFENLSLPILKDNNNYWSGKFGNFFWHQNADQVYVYIPIDLNISKEDVHVTFEAKQVTVVIGGKRTASFQCLERIIPDGSFWVFEFDVITGRKYLQLDLEKRFRMINWNCLFGEPQLELTADQEVRKREIIDKLMKANRGMSKLTGKPAESIEEMMSDQAFRNSIEEVNIDPVVDSSENINDSDESFNELLEKINESELEASSAPSSNVA